MIKLYTVNLQLHNVLFQVITRQQLSLIHTMLVV